MSSIGPTPFNVFPGSDGVTNVIEILSRRKIGLVLDYSYQEEAFVIKKNSASIPAGLAEGDLLVSVNNRDVLNESLEDVYALLQMIQLSADLEPNRLTFLTVSKCSKAIYSAALKKDSTKDKFGFHRNIHYLIKEDAAERARDSKIEQKRDEEFVGYLKKIGGVHNLKKVGGQCSEELLSYLVKGIPIAYRGSVWYELSQASHYRRVLGDNYYEQCLHDAESKLPSQTKVDIHKDLDRTFPDHDHFRYEGGESALCRVLTAYAMHNTEVGYCQGLNFVAGILILYCAEKEAFYILIATLEGLLPKDYYSRALLGHQIDQAVLKELLQRELPSIWSKLERERIELALVTVSWFLPLFTNTLRHDVSLRVLDMFFAEGSSALFRISLALFELKEKELLAASDHTELFVCLRELGSSVTSADQLMSIAYPAYSRYHGTPRGSPSTLSGLGLAHLGYCSPLHREEPLLPEKKTAYEENSTSQAHFVATRVRSQSDQVLITSSSGTHAEIITTPVSQKSRPMSVDTFASDASNSVISSGVKNGPVSLFRSLTDSVSKGRGSASKKGARNVESLEIERLRNLIRPGIEENLRSIEMLRRDPVENLECEDEKRESTAPPAARKIEAEEEKDNDSVDSDDQIDPNFLYPTINHDYYSDYGLDDYDFLSTHRRGILFWFGLVKARCDILM